MDIETATYLKGWLKDNGMTQKEAAEILGITQPSMAKKIKNGQIQLSDFLKLARDKGRDVVIPIAAKE